MYWEGLTGLFDELGVVFTSLGFEGLGDEVFWDLLIARVVEPTTLPDSGSVLGTWPGSGRGQLIDQEAHPRPGGSGQYRDRI